MIVHRVGTIERIDIEHLSYVRGRLSNVHLSQVDSWHLQTQNARANISSVPCQIEPLHVISLRLTPNLFLLAVYRLPVRPT